MATKYLADESTGTPLAASLTRSVVVTAEELVPAGGYEGDVVVYSATMKDDLGASLPSDFVVDVKFDGAVVQSGVILNAGNYDPGTFLFSVDLTIPAIVGAGNKTVSMTWAEQEIPE